MPDKSPMDAYAEANYHYQEARTHLRLVPIEADHGALLDVWAMVVTSYARLVEARTALLDAAVTNWETTTGVHDDRTEDKL